MEQAYTEDETFTGIDFTKDGLIKGDYESCTFIGCDFSNTHFNHILFSECTFTDCNLSMVNLSKTTFRDVVFKGCKMLGLNFDDCDKYGVSVSFEDCILNHASFFQHIVKKTTFKNTQLHEVDFSQADLSHSIFNNCDLLGSTFDNTNIEKADFRTAFNYSINLVKNKHKKAKFSLPGIIGLLDEFDIEIEGK